MCSKVGSICSGVALSARSRCVSVSTHAVGPASHSACDEPSVAWPHEHYMGVLRAPDFGIWPLVVVASGVRLSRSTALVGALAGVGAVSILVGIDYAYNAEQVAYRNADAVMAFALLFSAGLLAVRLATWVRSLVARTARAAGDAARTRQVLGAYVSEEVATILQARPIGFEGEARDVAVLFSDLRGFTAYSNASEPADLIREVNEYFEAMVAVIREHGGVVDKYIGDAIMVVFGIPEHRGDEATRAVRTAEGMRQALIQLNALRVKRGLQPMRQGLGIHYGAAIAGNVGTLERLQYTVLGDTVNYASRLEAATKELGVEVLLSDAVVARASDEGCSLVLERFADIEVRGRPGRHTVFTTPREEDGSE